MARNGDGETGAAPRCGVDADGAAVALGHQAGVVEPQAEAADLLPVARRHAVELLEDVFARAAVDAGMADHARQIGQTGVTVRPKLYIACGISGQIQHTAGMDGSAMVISINTDPDAPINKIADYAITGDVMEVIPKMIKYYKQNSK